MILSPASNVNIRKLFQQYLWKSIPQTYDIFIKIFTYNPLSCNLFPDGCHLGPSCMFTKILKICKMRTLIRTLIVIVLSQNLQLILWYFDITKSWKFAQIHGFSWLKIHQLSVILWSSQCTSHNFGSTDSVSLKLKWSGAIPVSSKPEINSSHLRSFQFDGGPVSIVEI